MQFQQKYEKQLERLDGSDNYAQLINSKSIYQQVICSCSILSQGH